MSGDGTRGAGIAPTANAVAHATAAGWYENPPNKRPKVAVTIMARTNGRSEGSRNGSRPTLTTARAATGTAGLKLRGMALTAAPTPQAFAGRVG